MGYGVGVRVGVRVRVRVSEVAALTDAHKEPRTCATNW